jgi:hypothetical protein
MNNNDGKHDCFDVWTLEMNGALWYRPTDLG